MEELKHSNKTGSDYNLCHQQKDGDGASFVLLLFHIPRCQPSRVSTEHQAPLHHGVELALSECVHPLYHSLQNDKRTMEVLVGEVVAEWIQWWPTSRNFQSDVMVFTVLPASWLHQYITVWVVLLTFWDKRVTVCNSFFWVGGLPHTAFFALWHCITWTK